MNAGYTETVNNPLHEGPLLIDRENDNNTRAWMGRKIFICKYAAGCMITFLYLVAVAPIAYINYAFWTAPSNLTRTEQNALAGWLTGMTLAMGVPMTVFGVVMFRRLCNNFDKLEKSILIAEKETLDYGSSS